MPRFSIVTPVFNPEAEHLEACLASVRDQTFTDWQHVLVDDGSTRDHVAVMLDIAENDPRVTVVRRPSQGGITAASGDGLAASTGEVVALLDHDDMLAPSALAAMAEAFEAGADVAYSDHDLIRVDGEHWLPTFKPDFSPEHLRSQNYILHFLAARRSLVDEVGGFRPGFDGAQDHDLVLRLTERAQRVEHIAEVLYHWRQAEGSVAADPEAKRWAYDAGRRAVAEHCERLGLVGASVEPGALAGTYRVRRQLVSRPLVSVIVPTRGGSGHVWGQQRPMVVDAVRSLVERSTYRELEFIVVADEGTPQRVITALERIVGDALTIVPYTKPFNFSDKINAGVTRSSGEYLLLLNDDTEMIEPDSIETMVAHLQTAGVGMVGPKLLFADGTVQDAGHVYNRSLLGALSGWPGDSAGPGRLRPLIVERECSGVTAAVALVARSVFDEVGGFPIEFPVNFNDVDFSLKLRAAGYRIIWTPHAVWYHFESQTRERSASDAEYDALDARWHHEINNDPYYNRNLAIGRADWLEQPFRSGAPPQYDAPESASTTTGWVDSARTKIVTQRVPILLAVAFAMLWWAKERASWAPIPWSDRVSGFVVGIGVLALVGAALRKQRMVLGFGLLVAMTPVALWAIIGDARSHLVAFGAVVCGLAIGPIGRRSRRAAIGLGVGAILVGAWSWWAQTPSAASVDRGVAAAPITRSVWAPWSGVPTGAIAIWWLLVGALVVLAVFARRWSGIVAIPAAVVLLFVGSWAIEQGRGVPSTSGGAFLLTGAVAFTAARLEPSRRNNHRFASAASTGMAAVWFLTGVRQIKTSVEVGHGSAPWSTWRSWELASSGVPAWLVVCVTAIASVLVLAVPLAIGSLRRRGVNIVGYHTITAGLGERTRQLVECCEAAGLRVASFDLDVASVREQPTLPVPSVRYDTTVLVVPAFETQLALDRYRDVVSGSRFVAGYWFWELDEIPAGHRLGLDVVDEVWAPTRFVRDAYSSATSKPVRLVPLPIPEPEPGPFDRADLGVGPDDFLFLTSFSYLSVIERKNPIGAIEAFRRAFPDDPDVRLVVKSINGGRKPVDVGRVRDAAGDDPRIVMWDEHVDAATQAGLIASADVFVSLHRSEGLGLHIADAMWLGTPVIATDYSGSRDVIDDTCGAIIPAGRVRVTRGDGAYPESSTWADPDLDAAVEAMRRLRSDPAARRDLAAAGRVRRSLDSDPRAAGRRIRRLLRGIGR